MLYVAALYGVCFLLSGSHVAALLTKGAQLSGFVMAQSYGIYPWQAYQPPGGGLLLTPRVH